MGHPKLNFAILGAGYWGPNLLRNLLNGPRSEVLWVADPLVARLDAIRKTAPSVQTDADWQAPLRDPRVDAVIVAAPTSRHYELAKASLLAGKHVLVEKPMTTDPAEARELAEIARQVQRQLMVGHVYLFHPRIRHVKRMLRLGNLGRPLKFHSVRENYGPIREDVGALWDLAPHDVSILLYLFESFPKRVSAVATHCMSDGRDSATTARLEFAQGLVAEIRVNWLAPHKVRQIFLTGSRRDVVFDEMADPQPPTVEPLKAECEAFLDAVLHCTPHPSDGGFGARVVQLLTYLSRSLALGGTPVEILPEFSLAAREELARPELGWG